MNNNQLFFLVQANSKIQVYFLLILEAEFIYRGRSLSVLLQCDKPSFLSSELQRYIFIDNDVGVLKNAEKSDTIAVFRVPFLKQIWV